jgi:polyisoprenoid-binding protein YceI
MNMKAKLFLAALAGLFVISATAQELKVDVSKSELKWNGKKVTGEHYGKINLNEGTLTLKDKKIESGKFVIDMNSITVDDLPAGEWNDKLVGHLKSDDFFGTTTHKDAVLEVTGSAPFTNGKAKVTGKLTIKGITNPVEFEATQSGNLYTALVTVDRSLYNVRYGSGKFFENLGDKAIYDNFTLDVKLVVK